MYSILEIKTKVLSENIYILYDLNPENTFIHSMNFSLFLLSTKRYTNASELQKKSKRNEKCSEKLLHAALEGTWVTE